MAAAVAVLSQWTWQMLQQCLGVARWTAGQLGRRLHAWIVYFQPNTTPPAGAEERAELLAWVNQQLPNQRVSNFGVDWTDGQVLCALVNALAPRAVPADQLSSQQPVLVVSAALRRARLLLKVDPTLTIMDVVWATDEQKLMQYLIRLRESANRLKKRFTLVKTPSFMASADPAPHGERGADAAPRGECTASGDGLRHAERGRTAEFTIVFPRTSHPDLLLELRSDSGDFFTQRVTERSPPRLALDDSLRTVSGMALLRNIPVGYRVTGRAVTVTYRPPSEGRLEVSVIWRGHHVAGSPFSVQVAPGEPEVEEEEAGEEEKEREAIVVSPPRAETMALPANEAVPPGGTLRPLTVLREVSREDELVGPLTDGRGVDEKVAGGENGAQENEIRQDDNRRDSEEEILYSEDDETLLEVETRNQNRNGTKNTTQRRTGLVGIPPMCREDGTEEDGEGANQWQKENYNVFQDSVETVRTERQGEYQEKAVQGPEDGPESDKEHVDDDVTQAKNNTYTGDCPGHGEDITQSQEGAEEAAQNQEDVVKTVHIQEIHAQAVPDQVRLEVGWSKNNGESLVGEKEGHTKMFSKQDDEQSVREGSDKFHRKRCQEDDEEASRCHEEKAEAYRPQKNVVDICLSPENSATTAWKGEIEVGAEERQEDNKEVSLGGENTVEVVIRHEDGTEACWGQEEDEDKVCGQEDLAREDRPSEDKKVYDVHEGGRRLSEENSEDMTRVRSDVANSGLCYGEDEKTKEYRNAGKDPIKSSENWAKANSHWKDDSNIYQVPKEGAELGRCQEDGEHGDACARGWEDNMETTIDAEGGSEARKYKDCHANGFQDYETGQEISKRVEDDTHTVQEREAGVRWENNPETKNCREDDVRAAWGEEGESSVILRQNDGATADHDREDNSAGEAKDEEEPAVVASKTESEIRASEKVSSLNTQKKAAFLDNSSAEPFAIESENGCDSSNINSNNDLNASLADTFTSCCAAGHTDGANQQRECDLPILTGQEMQTDKLSTNGDPGYMPPAHQSHSETDMTSLAATGAPARPVVSPCTSSDGGYEGVPASLPVDCRPQSAPISSSQSAAKSPPVAATLSHRLISGQASAGERVLTEFMDVAAAASCDRTGHGDDAGTATTSGNASAPPDTCGTGQAPPKHEQRENELLHSGKADADCIRLNGQSTGISLDGPFCVTQNTGSEIVPLSPSNTHQTETTCERVTELLTGTFPGHDSAEHEKHSLSEEGTPENIRNDLRTPEIPHNHPDIPLSNKYDISSCQPEPADAIGDANCWQHVIEKPMRVEIRETSQTVNMERSASELDVYASEIRDDQTLPESKSDAMQLAAQKELGNSRRNSDGSVLPSDNSCHGDKRHSLPNVRQTNTSKKKGNITGGDAFHRTESAEKMAQDSATAFGIVSFSDELAKRSDSSDHDSGPDISISIQDSSSRKHQYYEDSADQATTQPHNERIPVKAQAQTDGFTPSSFELQFERVSDVSDESDSNADAPLSPVPECPESPYASSPAPFPPVSASVDMNGGGVPLAEHPPLEDSERPPHSDGAVAPSVTAADGIGDRSLLRSTEGGEAVRERRGSVTQRSSSETVSEDQRPGDTGMVGEGLNVPGDATGAARGSHCPVEKSPKAENGLTKRAEGGQCATRPPSHAPHSTDGESSETERDLFLPADADYNLFESAEVSPPNKTSEQSRSAREVLNSCLPSEVNQRNVDYQTSADSDSSISSGLHDGVADMMALSGLTSTNKSAIDNTATADAAATPKYRVSSSNVAPSACSSTLISDPSPGFERRKNVLDQSSPLKSPGERREPARGPEPTGASVATLNNYSDQFSHFATPREARYRLHDEHSRAKVYLGPTQTRARATIVQSWTPPCVLSEPPAPADDPRTPVVGCDDRWLSDDGQVIGNDDAAGGDGLSAGETVEDPPPSSGPPDATSSDTLTKTVIADLSVADSTAQSEGEINALSGDVGLARLDAREGRSEGSRGCISDGDGSKFLTGNVTVIDRQVREQESRGGEVASTSSDGSGDEEVLRKLLPRSKPPEKLQTYEEIIEILECPSRDAVSGLTSEKYLNDGLSTDTEPASKSLLSIGEEPETFPGNAATKYYGKDFSGKERSLNSSHADQSNDSFTEFTFRVDAPIGEEKDGGVSSDAVVSQELHTKGNTICCVQDLEDKVDSRDGPGQESWNRESNDVSSKNVPEIPRSEETADSCSSTASTEASSRSGADGSEEDNISMGYESASSSSESGASVDTVRAICNTPLPRSLSGSSIQSVQSVQSVQSDAFSTYAESLHTDAGSLQDDSTEPYLDSSVATAPYNAAPHRGTPPATGSEAPGSLVFDDTSDARISLSSSQLGGSSDTDLVLTGLGATLRRRSAASFDSDKSVTESEKEKGGHSGQAADRKLVSKSTVYWAPGTPPPSTIGAEPLLLSVIRLDPDRPEPTVRTDPDRPELTNRADVGSAELEVRMALDSHELAVRTEAVSSKMAAVGSAREEQEVGSAREETAATRDTQNQSAEDHSVMLQSAEDHSVMLQSAEDHSVMLHDVNALEQGLTAGTADLQQDESAESDASAMRPDSTDGNPERARSEGSASNWLLAPSAPLGGHVARIVRRHSQGGEDVTLPVRSRRFSPTNCCVEETKRRLVSGSRSEVKPHVVAWTEIGAEGRVVRLREMFEQFIRSERRSALQSSRSLTSLSGAAPADERAASLRAAKERSRSTTTLWQPAAAGAEEPHSRQRHEEQLQEATEDQTDIGSVSGPELTPHGQTRRSLSCSAAGRPLSSWELSGLTADANRAHFEAIQRYFEGLRDGRIDDGGAPPRLQPVTRHDAALSWLRRRWPAAGSLPARFDLGLAGLRLSLGGMQRCMSPPTGDDDGDGLENAEHVVLAPAPAATPAPAPRVMREYPYLSRRRSRPRLLARDLIPHQELVRRARDRVVVFGPGLFQSSVGVDNRFQLYVPDPECTPQHVMVHSAQPGASTGCELRYLGYMYHEVTYRVSQAGWYRVIVILGAHAQDVDVLVRVT